MATYKYEKANEIRRVVQLMKDKNYTEKTIFYIIKNIENSELDSQYKHVKPLRRIIKYMKGRGYSDEVIKDIIENKEDWDDTYNDLSAYEFGEMLTPDQRDEFGYNDYNYD